MRHRPDHHTDKEKYKVMRHLSGETRFEPFTIKVLLPSAANNAATSVGPTQEVATACSNGSPCDVAHGEVVIWLDLSEDENCDLEEPLQPEEPASQPPTSEL